MNNSTYMLLSDDTGILAGINYVIGINHTQRQKKVKQCDPYMSTITEKEKKKSRVHGGT